VYYIKDPKGRFLYVELKDVYTNEHVIFDQAVLKSVEITQKMLDDYDR
jgi:ribosomal protein S27E